MLHHLLSKRLRQAREAGETAPWWVVGVLEKLEAGDLLLSTVEAWRIRRAITDYLTGSSNVDVGPAKAVGAAIDEAFETARPART
jgi:hypothetical protein